MFVFQSFINFLFVIIGSLNCSFQRIISFGKKHSKSLTMDSETAYNLVLSFSFKDGLSKEADKITKID